MNSCKPFSWEEVQTHNHRESCWVVIHGVVYDLSDFLDKHPGGATSILRYAGQDATQEYDAIHPPHTIEKGLSRDKHLGRIDVEQGNSDSVVAVATDERRKEKGIVSGTPTPTPTFTPTSPGSITMPMPTPMPTPMSTPTSTPIEACLNLNDLASAAKEVLSERAWVYYSSAAQDSLTLSHNLDDWKRVRFRPRIMRNVQKVSTARTILGFQSNLPFFMAPCALARLGHPDGELCLARGAARANIPYCVSNSSSVSHEGLAACLGTATTTTTTTGAGGGSGVGSDGGSGGGYGGDGSGGGGCLFFQLYVKRSKKETIQNIRRARDLGYKALVVTVDTNVVGIREDDERLKIREAEALKLKRGQPGQLHHTTTDMSVAGSASVSKGRLVRAPHSSTLNWEDLHWIKAAWQNAGPICLKGILTAEDVKIACDLGIDAVYLSNHGGRQLDSAPSALVALMEIRRFCPEVLTKCHILLDGGVRRGSDILKALCLGAAGVGLGRPFMYALSAYGTQGVHKAIEMLTDEIETTMRLLGVTSLDELGPHLVNTGELEMLMGRNVHVSEPRETGTSTRSRL
ncbi:hypothetical protein A1O3_03887 [Capronia epimyces CBS 606.96]|uniref:L-lactate dehydrogenase (Cytochrome) n=1 Tax=Capronia epimyces CBS 606.96 TaxID=1182542 RepID=W9Y372_9EURO|nr:uncharacterized protein A1O3_03887 [Capronia epimyces CBS 606.96]EXJ86933.1 hypothetical protein A1O3_03887 [Capronia epimyces CBS 606.96]